MIGIYEQAAQPWAVDGTPWEFGHELLQNNLDRIADPLEYAFERYPCLREAGIKRVINGPFTFAPDGNPLVGPVPGLRNFWSACGVMAGFSQGGGVGLTLAQWMVDGEPARDVFAMDVARYGSWCTRAYTRNKVVENYQRRFAVSYPNEELPAARPLNTTPAYQQWKARNAVFGQGYGLEHVNYFAPAGEAPIEIPSFRRSNAFDSVAKECHGVRSAVGINEIHNFGKYRVRGADAATWLDRIMAGRVPRPGRISLTPMLSPSGRIIGDFTISNLGEDDFALTASYSARAFHMRWFEANVRSGEDVHIEDESLERLGFQIAGPFARDVLAATTRADVSNEAFPFMSLRQMEVGLSDATVQRLSYTGDLGYEIYVPAASQGQLFDALMQAGEPFGLQPFGMHAMMSLRLEKSFGSWMREYRPDYLPMETGLDRFVAYDKAADFIGNAAALAERDAGPARRIVTLVVEASDADAWGDEPIWHDGDVVGFVTSGGFAHFVGTSVAMGFLPTALVAAGREVEIEILGERRPARVVDQPLFDPRAERMRGIAAKPGSS